MYALGDQWHEKAMSGQKRVVNGKKALHTVTKWQKSSGFGGGEKRMGGDAHGEYQAACLRWQAS